jgi:hypothetical protein
MAAHLRWFIGITAVLHGIAGILTARLGKDVVIHTSVQYHPWFEPASSEKATQLSLKALLIAFSFLSCAFQLAPVVTNQGWSTYYRYATQLGVNPLRWIEYSFSASALTLAAQALLGETNVFMYVLTFVGTWTVMMLGLLQELSAIRDRRLGVSASRAAPEPASLLGYLDYVLPHLIGWPFFIATWVSLITQFGAVLRYARDSNGEKAPQWVIVFFYIEFLLFSSFGVLQAVQQSLSYWYFFGKRDQAKWVQTMVRCEYAYTALSAGAKMLAVGLLVVGLKGHTGAPPPASRA